MRINEQSPRSSSQSSTTPSIGSLFFSLLTLVLSLFLAASVWAQGTPTINVPTTYSGLSVNNVSNFPPSGTTFGVVRLWDTPGTSWPAMQTASGTTLTTAGKTALATVLADAYSNSTNNDAVGMYTLSRTPYWATSNQTDTTCNYYNATNWNGGTGAIIYAPGQCDLPSDINADGSGTDLTWRNWITALATYLNTLTTANGYAQVKYFEPWNEFDRTKSLLGLTGGSNLSYQGSYAQLLRLTEDARCILTGSSSVYIHNYPTAGTSTQCSSTTWTGQSVGYITDAQILSPSSHAQGSNWSTGTGLVQNFLYCTSPVTGTDCNWGSGSNWGSGAVDIINFHMKPGNEAPGTGNTDPETEMATEYNHITGSSGILDATDEAKPLWNGEAGYSAANWTPVSGDVDLSSYPDQQAAFVARYALIQWSLGIESYNWYNWDVSFESSGTVTDAGTAYSEVGNWMVGHKMSFSCAVVSGTLWSCTFTKGSTWKGKVFWDTSSTYNCEGSGANPCTTYSYNVPGTGWTLTRTALGVQTSISSPFTIQVSNLPVIIMSGSL
jgi:hypothetical protein